MIFLFLYLLVFLVCVALLVLFTTELWASFVTVAPFVPIPQHMEEAILAHLELDADSVLYDLGCGDGRILLAATDRFPTITAVGIEKVLRPYLLARWKTRDSSVQILHTDFFSADLSKATHVFAYLFPRIPDKILKMMHTQCAPGTRFISCDFEATEYAPTEVIEVNPTAPLGKRLFVYTI